MFYVYNIETESVEKVDKINPKIHRHRNTQEVFTFEEEIVQSEAENVVETTAKKAGRPKK